MKAVAVCCAVILAATSLSAQGVVQKHLAAARQAREQKDYAAAEREGAAAADEAQKIFGPSEVLREALSDLGLTYSIGQKLALAEQAYRRAVDVGAASPGSAP